MLHVKDGTKDIFNATKVSTLGLTKGYHDYAFS